MNRRAEMGVGTLILFIATIVVSAIAAGVLTQTAGSLQSQALKTAKDAQGSVATRLDVLSLTATDGSDGTIEDFNAEVRPSAGAEAMNLKALSLSMGLSNMSEDLVYSNGSCAAAANASGDGYYSANGTGTFTVSYIQTSSNHVDGVLQPGEVAKLCFAAPRSIGEDEQFSIRLLPKVGMTTSTTVVAPSVMVTKDVLLYP